MFEDNFLQAADTARIQAGGQSIYDKVADAMTAGVAGATISGLSSIYNTGVQVSNKVFGTDAQEIDTADVLGSLNSDWVQYYKDNKEVIDTVGFLGASFIPGSLAVKGLKLVQAGKSFGTFGAALGFTSNMQAKFLQRGLQELAQEGGTVFSRINAAKLASMSFGVADNVLQIAAFETATAATMHASPMFADESFKDIAWDIIKTSLTGGLIGGGVEALFTNRIFRDAGKLVDKTQRKYDSIASLEKMGMTYGDETFSVMDELFKLPKQVLQEDKFLPFSYKLNGREAPPGFGLDVSGLYERKLKDTTERTLQIFQTKLTQAVKADSSIGRPVASALLDIYKEGTQAGVADGVIKAKIGDYLFGLKEIKGIGAMDPDFLKEVVYLSPQASIKSTSDLAALFSNKKITDKDVGFRIIGNLNEAKVGVVGVDAANQKLAFQAGYDLVLSGTEGKITFNPDSSIFRKVGTVDDNTMQVIFNTRTKKTADSVVPTIADVATETRPLRITKNGLVSGDYSYEFSPGNFNPADKSVKATARHLWASQITSLDKITIDSKDFALLDALASNPKLASSSTLIKMADGTTTPFSEMSTAKYSNWLLNQKIEAAQEMFTKSKGAVDIREVAYKLNSEPAWVENLISAEFRGAAVAGEEGVSRELAAYGSRENVVFAYDTSILEKAKAGDFPTATLAYEYRKLAAKQATMEASTAVLKKDADLFMDLTHPSLTKKFDATGVGATGAGFSNADYGDIGRLWAQDTGKSVNLVGNRRGNEVLLTLQPKAAALILDAKEGPELAAITTKVRRSDKLLTIVDNRLVDLSSQEQLERYLKAGKTVQAQDVSFAVNIKLSPKVADFLHEHMNIHARQLADKTILANAQGTPIHWNPRALYVPPIDTRKVPYFAFVRDIEGKAFGTSEVAMITARNPEELQRLANQIDLEKYQVLFKGDTAEYYKALGDYDYSRAMNNPTIDPFLRKQGKLGDFLPSLDTKATVEDYITYHARKEKQLVRDSVEVRFAQTFNELQFLSSQNTKVAESKLEFLGSLAKRTIADPFQDYIKTALDISKRSEFTLWHQANEFVDALGTRAYQAIEKGFQEAKIGKIDWNEANKIMEKVGIPGPFSSQEAFLTAQVGNDRNIIKQAVSKANMLLSTIALRLDFANSIINTISTPILLGTEMSSIRQSISKNPELAGKLAELTSVLDPANKVRVPSTLKLLYNAVTNFWTPEGKELLKGRYKDIGAVKDIVSQYHQMVEDLSLVPNVVPKVWAEKVAKWTDKATTITGNNFAEDFTRFVSADVMRQMTDPLVAAGRMGVKEQNAYISIFVNRVQGNYIASQRPIMFQGTIGAAVGLFQTYQFNMFQQLFRHIENRDLRTLAVMGGLQTSIFGLNGLPFFEAINTHLIGQANINEGHNDAYSFAVRAAGKEIGDWALYGTASAFPIFSDKMPSLYTRGDLNPRHVSIIPTSFSQIPAVEAGSRVVSAVLGIGKAISSGGDVGASLLQGLEHNGINRPLAGIAQTLQGASTTSTGSLISSNSDFSSIATASRILGAKPMDESVALNAKFRLEAYKAADRARIEDLGTVVKQKIRDGTLSADDVNEFAARYAAVGGQVSSFGAAMQRWSKNANQSIVNTILESQRTSYGRRMNEIMGADPLPDALNIQE